MECTNEKCGNAKCCPIDKTLSLIGKRWSIQIIRDLFMGKKRFSEFLESNKDLSTKMLSARLKDLQEHKLIEKKIVSSDPVVIEYSLTRKGKGLNKILYELAIFSMKYSKKDVLGGSASLKKATKATREIFAA